MKRFLALLMALPCVASCENVAEKSATEPAQGGVVVSAAGLDPTASEASKKGRLLIGRGKDYVHEQQDPGVLFKELEGSMFKRRQLAWKIVEAMLAPQELTIGGTKYAVPLWHTWYEGMSVNPEVRQKIALFVATVQACRADAQCKKTRAEMARETLADVGTKNLVRSLTEDNFTQTLKQFEGNPEGELGQGFTLFSPRFVEHLLTHAEEIEKCDTKTAWDKEPPSSTQFSHCLPEFPRDAVMVKTTWQELAKVNPTMSFAETDAKAMTAVIANGTWPLEPRPEAPADEKSMYVVQATDKTKYGLTGIHFSTKDVREWVWVSLWWSPQPDGDFGEDRPASVKSYNNGVWANYKMCVVSAFAEGDAEPWSAFATAQPSLAAALRASHETLAKQVEAAPHDKVTTWCSNPNVETQTGNGRSSCIGCHQYSSTWNNATGKLTDFRDTLKKDGNFPQFGRSLRRKNFPADFAWSFSMEFKSDIRMARDQLGFQW